MKVLVTGVGGQLGHDVMNELARRGHQGVGSDIAPVYSGIADGSAVTEMPYVAMDITNEQQVRQVMDQVRPDAVIHCAAWTAVDLAEDADKQPKVRAINVDGTAHLAQACREMDCKMMYISTDYVFNGQGETPWQPDCKDYQPLNFYGETKLGGELAVSSALEKYFIVRIAWVFGLNGKNFIKTMLQLGRTHDKLRVVCDQIGTPTYTLDLARLLVDMIESDKYGYYHATNEGGYISWYDFACEIFRQAGLPVQVDAVTTAEYGASKAARPFNSRLDKSKLAENGFTPLPAMISMRPAARTTSARRSPMPSDAVLRPPEVRMRVHPVRTTSSSASERSHVMSNARWKVVCIGPASATRAAVRAVSTRPSGVSKPKTTPSAPHSRAKRTSSSICRNSASS